MSAKINNYHGKLILCPSMFQGLKSKSEILMLPVRSISKESMKKQIGVIFKSELKQIQTCLQELLTF